MMMKLHPENVSRRTAGYLWAVCAAFSIIPAQAENVIPEAHYTSACPPDQALYDVYCPNYSLSVQPCLRRDCDTTAKPIEQGGDALSRAVAMIEAAPRRYESAAAVQVAAVTVPIPKASETAVNLSDKSRTAAENNADEPTEIITEVIAKVMPPKAKKNRSQNAGKKGVASWYGPGFHGRVTANGERYNQEAMTAAHKSLPFGSRVVVRDVRTKREVIVRINDRGPYVDGRVIDLSAAAARALGIFEQGIAKVELRVLKDASAV